MALRAGNEKDEDQADTVGCCSIRVEHIKLHEEYDGKEFVVEFDFLGKDSIRYYNRVEVEKRVFKNLQLFMENKQDGDDLFDRLNVSRLLLSTGKGKVVAFNIAPQAVYCSFSDAVESVYGLGHSPSQF